MGIEFKKKLNEKKEVWNVMKGSIIHKGVSLTLKVRWKMLLGGGLGNPM